MPYTMAIEVHRLAPSLMAAVWLYFAVVGPWSPIILPLHKGTDREPQHRNIEQ